MLKKSSFSPPQPWRAGTRPSPNVVLASLRGSTYSLGERLFPEAMGGRVKRVYASPLCSLRPCRTAFLSIPQGYSHNILLEPSLRCPPIPSLRLFRHLGHLQFYENTPFKEDFDRAGGRVVRRQTGHLVFYRSDGRRFLATDPAGNPLHECDWGTDPKGRITLRRARVKLDWGAWVGLKPSGLVNETTLNLATKTGWQRLSADDLRAMAAQALRVPLEEVRWFYRDEDLSISQTGTATIRHRKDALYVLEDGEFRSSPLYVLYGRDALGVD